MLLHERKTRIMKIDYRHIYIRGVYRVSITLPDCESPSYFKLKVKRHNMQSVMFLGFYI